MTSRSYVPHDRRAARLLMQAPFLSMVPMLQWLIAVARARVASAQTANT